MFTLFVVVFVTGMGIGAWAATSKEMARLREQQDYWLTRMRAADDA